MDAMLSIAGIDAGWSDFVVAAAGASAALAGLTIVTISVNVRQILAYPALIPRAAITIAGFVVALLAALAVLIPQVPAAMGIEVLIASLVAVYLEVLALRGDLRQKEHPIPPAVTVSHVITAASWILAFLLCGVLLIAGATTAGLFALAFGVGAAIVASIVNTWVLLIEILR